MTYGSLCSGIDGIGLGLERAGMECRFQCEIDPFCLKVLEKYWPDVKRYTDLRQLDPAELEHVDLLCGGYPCQPFSQAGKRGGENDPRHLWPEFARIIRVLRPRYVLLENVAGHLSLGFGRVLGDLAGLGYDAEWACFRASDFGASHLRKRVFIVAYRSSEGRREDARSAPCHEEADGRSRRDALQSNGNYFTGCEGPELADSAPRGRGELRESSGRGGQSDGRGEVVADATGARREECQPDRIGELSAEAGRGIHDRPERSGGELDNSASPRFAGRQSGAGEAGMLGGREQESGGRCNAMADPSDGFLSQPRRGSQGRDGAGSALEVLSDPSGAGLPDAEPGPESTRRSTPEFCGAFAPGPNDHRWPAIIREYPWLAPAIDMSDGSEEAAQPGFHSLAHGISAGLVRSAMKDRTKKLKAAGNAVVPQIAEHIGRRIMEFDAMERTA